jgi:hypothetical protein
VPMGRAYRGSQAGPASVSSPPGLSAHGHKNRGAVPMSLERRWQPILVAAGDEVGWGQWLELHGKEGNQIWGSRESGSSPGDRSTAAVVRAEGISGDGVVRWLGRPALVPCCSMGKRQSSGRHHRWWTVDGDVRSTVWCSHGRGGRC